MPDPPEVSADTDQCFRDDACISSNGKGAPVPKAAGELLLQALDPTRSLPGWAIGIAGFSQLDGLDQLLHQSEQ
ncbi:MAG: hypothetical protein ACAH65_05930 [Chloroflexota bacterium]